MGKKQDFATILFGYFSVGYQCVSEVMEFKTWAAESKHVKF